MAKQLGDVLRNYVADEDLYAMLARAVAEARRDLGMSHRTQGPMSAGESADLESGLVLLEEDGKPVQPDPARTSRRPLRAPETAT